MSRTVLFTTLAALSLALPPARADEKAKDETPSDRIRKALDQPIDLELKEPSLAKAVERFRDKTHLDITFTDPNPGAPQPIERKFKGIKVRDALRKTLEPWGLMPFIVDDAVLLTSEEDGIQKQLKQRIDVDVDEVPLAKAVKQLARRKAMNLIVDPKAAKQAEKKVTLQLEDVAVETAVRLLAEQAELKAARIDNVLYVTTPERAASIAAENRANQPNFNPYGPYAVPGMIGGVGALGTPLGGIGVIGLGGLAGLGGGGGIMGRPVLPPLPPPSDVKPPKELPPDKPQGQAPRRRPILAAADTSDFPCPTVPRPEPWARPAGRSTVGSRRSRRRLPSPDPAPSFPEEKP
jgi:hypothetical protein